MTVPFERHQPTQVVLDTDMATDCDDAGALALLHTLIQRDEARLLAAVTNNKGAYSIGAVAAINAAYGRTDVPLGAYQGDLVGTETASFFELIARDTDTYGHEVVTRDDVPDATRLYRSVLADADSNEVVIVSIGHLNNLCALLESAADSLSSRSGRELVADRVAELVVMGGELPAGREHNFAARNSHHVTASVIDRWPTPILVSGYELGAAIQTGPGLSRLSDSHPVRIAYERHPSDPIETGRPSWDQTAVLAAVRNPTKYWELSGSGRLVIADDGSNTWRFDTDASTRYLIERTEPDARAVADAIESLMVEGALV